MQRSFRLSSRTAELLDDAASESAESRNALADRLLGEAMVERHPLIRFRSGAAGRSQPLIVGTRLYVHQMVATVRANQNDVDLAAEYLRLEPLLVRAALNYYAEFTDEVDGDAAEAERSSSVEHARWERQQHALG